MVLKGAGWYDAQTKTGSDLHGLGRSSTHCDPNLRRSTPASDTELDPHGRLNEILNGERS